jgi:hypothetical protein
MVEKAAADAALRPQGCHGGILKHPVMDSCHPFDSYSSRFISGADCKRRNIGLLLYQRYVHKFGSTGQIKLPPSASASSSRKPCLLTAVERRRRREFDEAPQPCRRVFPAPPPSQVHLPSQVPAMKAVIEVISRATSKEPSSCIQTLGRNRPGRVRPRKKWNSVTFIVAGWKTQGRCPRLSDHDSGSEIIVGPPSRLW